MSEVILLTCKCGEPPCIEDDGEREIYTDGFTKTSVTVFIAYCYDCDSLVDVGATSPRGAIEAWNKQRKKDA